MSTVQFVNPEVGFGMNLVGNMGAPLRTDDDDILEDEELHVSESPLNFGLAGQDDEGFQGPRRRSRHSEDAHVSSRASASGDGGILHDAGV